MSDFKRPAADPLLNAYFEAVRAEDARPSAAISAAVLAAAAAQAAPLKATPANDAANLPFWSIKRYGGAMAASIAVCSLAALLVVNNPGINPGQFEPSEAKRARVEAAPTQAAAPLVTASAAAPAPAAVADQAAVLGAAQSIGSPAKKEQKAQAEATKSVAENDNRQSQSTIYSDKKTQAISGESAKLMGRADSAAKPAGGVQQAPAVTAAPLAQPSTAKRAEASPAVAEAVADAAVEREFAKSAPPPARPAAPIAMAPAAPAAVPAPAAAQAPPPVETSRSVLPNKTESSAEPAGLGRQASAAAPLDATQRLLQAAASGQLPAVQAALSQGANVNARDPSGRTALHRAVLGKHLQVVRALLAAGADRNITDASGATALQLAKRANLAEIAAELEP